MLSQMFNLVQSQYAKINTIFSENYAQFIDDNFENRIKKAISVLHFAYLLGTCKEAKAILSKIDINSLNLY